jgi:hypothetical protein
LEQKKAVCHSLPLSGSKEGMLGVPVHPAIPIAITSYAALVAMIPDPQMTGSRPNVPNVGASFISYGGLFHG